MIPLDKETFEAYMERLLEQVEKVVGAFEDTALMTAILCSAPLHASALPLHSATFPPHYTALLFG